MSRLSRLFRRRHPAVVVVPAADAHTLTSRERLEIGDWLNNPTTQKVLAIVESRHPGLRTAGVSKVARNADDAYGAVFLLNRIAGWESYRNTLVTLAAAPQATGDLPETYPTVIN